MVVAVRVTTVHGDGGDREEDGGGSLLYLSRRRRCRRRRVVVVRDVDLGWEKRQGNTYFVAFMSVCRIV